MRFVIDLNNVGRFHWRLIGDDGADLALSAASFASAADAGRAAALVRLHAGSPAPEDDPVLVSAASVLG
jgi:hypothetical protein